MSRLSLAKAAGLIRHVVPGDNVTSAGQLGIGKMGYLVQHDWLIITLCTKYLLYSGVCLDACEG